MSDPGYCDLCGDYHPDIPNCLDPRLDDEWVGYTRDDLRDTIVISTTKGHTVNAPTPTELDFDTVTVLGLDGTGRDGDDRWPYTLENLTDQEFLTLLFLAYQAETYPDEAEAPETALWYEGTNQEFERRYGAQGVENLADYATGSHASNEDLLRTAREDVHTLLDIIRGA